MLDTPQALALDAHDMKLVQDALHTQEKILSVQARAGGNAAKRRLSEVRLMLSRIEQQAPARSGPESAGAPRKSFFARLFAPSNAMTCNVK